MQGLASLCRCSSWQALPHFVSSCFRLCRGFHVSVFLTTVGGFVDVPCDFLVGGPPLLRHCCLQNLIFRFLQSKSRIQIWLFEQKDLGIEGRIIGFDEYMNLVLQDAEEISL
ncbi:unnamed protein product [Calypogeia fissa]